MASKSVTLRQQANISRWIQEVQSCCNRPAEMTVQDWCDEHGIKSSTYYQHYLKVKDLCVEQMKTQLTVVEPQSTFVELKEPVSTPNNTISISCGNVRIELKEDVSESFLIKVFGALSHVE